MSSFGAYETFDAKSCQLPEISQSDGRGQDHSNKQCLAWALTLESHPFRRFGLNYKKNIIR